MTRIQPRNVVVVQVVIPPGIAVTTGGVSLNPVSAP